MNTYFSPGDWAVILLYVLGIIALGVWFGKDQRNTRDYFLGSKNVPWWGIGLSIVAAETSALTIIGVPAMAYGGNIAFLQMIIGYVVARILLAIVLVPHYFKGEIYSPYQLFANTFGPSARQTAGGPRFAAKQELGGGLAGARAERIGEKLIGRVDLALEIVRDEDDGQNNAGNDIANDHLEEYDVAAVSHGRHPDDGQGAGFGGDDGQADAPPGDVLAAEKVVAGIVLVFAKPHPEADNPKHIEQDDRPITRTEV